MPFKYMISNPPFKGCDKIISKCFEVAEHAIFLSPPEWIQNPSKKSKEKYQDLIENCKSVEHLTDNQFREYFGLRMELPIDIMEFKRGIKNPVKFANHELVEPEKSLEDQVEKYIGQKYFLVVRRLGNANESPISFGIANGKPFKLFDCQQIFDGDTVEDAYNRRRKRAGKGPIKDLSQIVGIPCKNKKDVEGLRDYILENHELLKKVHIHHTYNLKWVPAYK